MRLSSKQRPLKLGSGLSSDGLIFGPNQSVISHCMPGQPKYLQGPLFGRKAHSRSLGFARDDKGEGGDFC